MRKLIPYAAVAVASSVLTGGVIAAVMLLAAPASATTNAKWAWQVGDSKANLGRYANSKDLWVNTQGDFNVVAKHIRLDGTDGNFEFEGNAPESTLNAYTIGTPKRLPISVGGDDGQDVLSFVVRGRSKGQKHDLQEWQLGQKVVASVDGKGRLHLGPLTLVTGVQHGKAVLQAILPNGHRQTLATG